MFHTLVLQQPVSLPFTSFQITHLQTNHLWEIVIGLLCVIATAWMLPECYLPRQGGAVDTVLVLVEQTADLSPCYTQTMVLMRPKHQTATDSPPSRNQWPLATFLAAASIFPEAVHSSVAPSCQPRCADTWSSCSHPLSGRVFTAASCLLRGPFASSVQSDSVIRWLSITPSGTHSLLEYLAWFTLTNWRTFAEIIDEHTGPLCPSQIRIGADLVDMCINGSLFYLNHKLQNYKYWNWLDGRQDKLCTTRREPLPVLGSWSEDTN